MEEKKFSLALNQGLRILSRQNLSKKELGQKLLGKNFEEDLVCAVLVHCEERGYLNEEEKAEQIVRSGLRSGHGPLRIGRDLEKRGIPEGFRKKALENASMEKNDHLKHVALKKLSTLSGRDLLQKKAKLYRFLLSRGFSSPDILNFMRDSEGLFRERNDRS